MRQMTQVLGSWKEIAAYLGKGVRTVQRWEADLALPVHRPTQAQRGIVMAFPGELDVWSRRHFQTSGGGTPQLQKSHQTRGLAADLLKRTAEITRLAQAVNDQCQAILAKAKNRGPRRSA